MKSTVAIGMFLALLLGGLAMMARPHPPHYTSSVISALSSTSGIDGFSRAVAVRPFVFPRDYGPHADFQTEWWYYTGNLDTAEGRHFGYQLTFFRRALAPPRAAVARSSRWACDQVYFAHFAVSDVATRRFHASERWSRAALDLAGAHADPFAVWVETWRADGQPDTHLQATQDNVSIDLHLSPRKAMVLQGDRGLSRKSDEVGNASYYYSSTRLETHGSLQVGGQLFAVRGLSWFDREWSTSALSQSDCGWDWFALQTDDGRELMLYHLRRKDGGVDPSSAGTLVERNGDTHPLAMGDFHIDNESFWKSPRHAASYPAAWRVRVPRYQIDWSVTPYQPDQELPLTFTYWEGAVAVHGPDVKGSGYVELTGYAPSGQSEYTAH